mmetsp:Transcript_3262/g.6728  ORF Transcript_3262/g.6728 Transcript_3262/m.6728 type:complete len:365 (-) Transcript_3262:32-1126(-)
MNIFLLSLNLRLCAQYHVDKHVVKMILEAAQMLCTALWLTGGKAPYKPAHKKHPCTIWCTESLANWRFLKALCFELNEEFKYRYDNEIDHKSWLVAKDLTDPSIPDIGLTTFAQAMPDQYKCDDAVTAYRRYYVGAKHEFAQWSKRDRPEWYDPMRAEHVRLYGEDETFLKPPPKTRRRSKKSRKDRDAKQIRAKSVKQESTQEEGAVVAKKATKGIDIKDLAAEVSEAEEEIQVPLVKPEDIKPKSRSLSRPKSKKAQEAKKSISEDSDDFFSSADPIETKKLKAGRKGSAHSRRRQAARRLPEQEEVLTEVILMQEEKQQDDKSFIDSSDSTTYSEVYKRKATDRLQRSAKRLKLRRPEGEK